MTNSQKLHGLNTSNKADNKWNNWVLCLLFHSYISLLSFFVALFSTSCHLFFEQLQTGVRLLVCVNPNLFVFRVTNCQQCVSVSTAIFRTILALDKVIHHLQQTDWANSTAKTSEVNADIDLISSVQLDKQIHDTTEFWDLTRTSTRVRRCLSPKKSLTEISQQQLATTKKRHF